MRFEINYPDGEHTVVEMTAEEYEKVRIDAVNKLAGEFEALAREMWNDHSDDHSDDDDDDGCPFCESDEDDEGKWVIWTEPAERDDDGWVEFDDRTDEEREQDEEETSYYDAIVKHYKRILNTEWDEYANHECEVAEFIHNLIPRILVGRRAVTEMTQEEMRFYLLLYAGISSHWASFSVLPKRYDADDWAYVNQQAIKYGVSNA